MPGATFALRVGVLHGGVLSPTVYNLYVALLQPPCYPDCQDIIYADDITQTITSPYRYKRDIARRTQIEIDRINQFERAWKIKINPTRFQIILIAQRESPPTHINNEIMNTQTPEKYSNSP